MRQYLPRSKQGPKVTTITEEQDVKTFKLDDRIRKLLTYKIHLHKQIEEEAPQHRLALKSNDIEMQLEESEHDEDESLAMIAKGFKKYASKSSRI